ncbi:TetR/AcrR family transcriptional regulator [Actinosynnema sp. NPDC023587]|uniref:TetR/AcrR family transcriptional regulator n=1 Tax=Actinosynnema sp. NPDC023587 TaxID=3154695 RepID=UPI0033F0D095
MPKRVDHDRRREELAGALVRCARVHGLHATGFREVAAEAGVSVNLVQYYFPTKQQLLHGGLLHLRARISRRLSHALAALPEPADPVAQVRAILVHLMPHDQDSADLYRVHAAYAALALTDPALAAQPHTAGPDELHPVLTDLVTRAGQQGRTDPRRDPRTTATTLLALATGLSAYTTSGYHTAADAVRGLDDQLDLLFPPADPSPVRRSALRG